MRVISLACSNTEIVAALGAASQLVAVDDHSDYPAEVVAELPRVGPDLDIEVERVAALEPDLVLASLTVPGHEAVVERLARAGLVYVAPEPVSLEDVYRDIAEIGRLLGREAEAAHLIGELRRQIVPNPAAPVEDARPQLLVQWWPKPVIAPGRLSWIHDLLELAGATHPLAAEEVKSRPMEVDEVRAAAPDACVLSWCGVAPEKVREDVIYREPAWRELPFVRNRRVYRVPEAITGRPSPRLAEGYRELCRIVDEIVAGGTARP